MFGVEEIQSPSAPTTSQSWRSLLTPHSPPCFHLLAVCFVYDDMCVTSSAAESLQQKKKKKRKTGNKLLRLFPEYNLRNVCWEGNKTSTIYTLVEHMKHYCPSYHSSVRNIACVENCTNRTAFFPQKKIKPSDLSKKKTLFILFVFFFF